MENQKGAWYLVAAALLCSIGGVCMKGIPWTPLAINGARCALAACVTALHIFKSHHKLRMSGAVMCGALSLALTTVFHVFANKLTNAACAILLMYTAPIWVLVYLWIWKKQKPTNAAAITCAAVLVGIGLLMADGFAGGTTALGNICALASGICYAGVFLVNIGAEGDAQSSYFFGQLIGAAVGVPFVFGEQNFSPFTLLCVAALGIFQLGLSYVFMAKGIQNTPPVAASLITALEPMLSPVWVALVYGEMLSGAALGGAVLVLGGIVYYNTRRAQQLSG